MGTRGLTMVVCNNETKVAQYGQWDHYPSGQGITILKFLRDKEKVQKLRGKMPITRFENSDDVAKLKEFLESIGAKDGWLDMGQSEKVKAKFPFFSRDLGGEVLEAIINSTDEAIVLRNSETFALDSLFCEYGYVVDLDKNTFEIYCGFNKEPLADDERFAVLAKNSPSGQDDREEDMKYAPIRIWKTYSLDELPTEETFLKDLSNEDDEDE